jgi:hypothetical protein
MPEEAPIDDLRHSEALYRSLVERLPALTYISDAGGRTTYIVSEQVDRLLKLTEEDRDVDVDTPDGSGDSTPTTARRCWPAGVKPSPPRCRIPSSTA